MRLAVEIGGQHLAAVVLDGRLHPLPVLAPQDVQNALLPEDLDAQVGVVDALGVVERAILGELRETADVVKQGHHLGDLLLMIVESQLLGQNENLLRTFAGYAPASSAGAR